MNSKEEINKATILDRIVATKRQEIRAAEQSLPESELRARIKDAPPVRNFFEPLAASGPIKLIAEVKKASPSKGVIRADFDPLAIARVYANHGATCLSVLTDEKYLSGQLAVSDRYSGRDVTCRSCARISFSTAINCSKRGLLVLMPCC